MASLEGEMGAGAASAPAAVQTVASEAADRKTSIRAAMLHGPIAATLIRLALPTVTVMLAQTGVNIAEAYYVGLLGTDAMAGVAMVFPILMLMTMMSAGGIGSGVSAAVARKVGEGRSQDADALVLHSVVLAVALGALFTTSLIVLGPALYRSLGGGGRAAAAALEYSDWLFAGAIPLWIVNLLAAVLRGSGNVRLPALVTFVGAVVLVPLSPALIFGLGPVPRLGVAGAGVAYALYYLGAALVLLRTMMISSRSPALRPGRLDLRLFWEILRVGLPTAFSSVMVNLTIILLTGIVSRFGTAALAGYGAASRLDYILVPLLFGLASAVLSMVGVNLGAGQGGRALRTAWTGGLIALAVTQPLGLVVAVRPDLWLRFYTTVPAVLAAGAAYLHVVALTYGVFGFGFVIGFAGQGAGKVIWSVGGVATRLTIAAGTGWVAVDRLGLDMHDLSWIVATSILGYSAVSAIILWRHQVWSV